MGDRASLGVIGTYPTHSGLERACTWAYTHWEGGELPERVRVALQRAKPRYGEPLYVTRILYDAVVLDPGTLDGYALGPRPLDTEHNRPLLVVDLDARTVGVTSLDRRANLPVVERSIAWADYIRRAPRKWGRDLLAK